MPGKRGSLGERFWAKVLKGGADDCWLWTGALAQGYGRLLKGGRGNGIVQATAAAWFLTHGEWPDGFMLHKCDNRQCVNPSHLFVGSQGDNVRDAFAKHRVPLGAQRINAKLTDEKAVEIFLSPDNSHVLAERYGVSPAAIRHVQCRVSWKHATCHLARLE